MAPRRTANAPRLPPPLQALLGLSDLLARARQGAVLSEALTVVLEGLGASRGAVYTASPDGLDLVADEGLPATLRAYVTHFPATETPWFPAHRAAKTRRATVEPDAASALAIRIDPSLVQSAGWSVIAAAPIVLGREVLGVLVAASPDPLAPEAAAILETAANMLALSLARERAQEKAQDDERARAGAAADAKLARLAVLGALAAGFADELRWPLSSLGSQLEEQEKLLGNLRVRYPGVSPAIDALSRIHDEATTALRFARTAGARLLSAVEESSPEPVDLSELSQEAAALVEPTARSRGVDLLVTAMHGSDPVVIGRKAELGQLVLSLVMNGLDACASIIKPAEEGEEAQKPLVCVTVAREKGRVIMRVEDAGPGIPPDVRPRIFEPFFSTKKGAPGLGLTLARQVVESHGGGIELDRSDLGGALVRIALPAAPEGTSVPARDRATSSKRKPRVSMPGFDGIPAATVRNGWTAPPLPIERASRHPVRAPQAVGQPLVVMADADVCAPTQRVPGDFSGGNKRKPSVAETGGAASERAKASDASGSPSSAGRGDSSRRGGGVPTTDRVPEVPGAQPRSKRAAKKAAQKNSST
ncbi:sensor histidine kinase [Polyangium aurulentum]|uniref:sensor histidine kinase n=1 Tax=Polyangium aurulentum TaxID=2567896 RepID=UPI0010ADB626|nr:HAMP domain-containing sensor histidine kinase [Polyangium aurulentum]UQA57910.1 HAMP domain-containing histidine kinase [Polyangium aurulentum]